jgi:hypothetical protein
MSFDILMDAPSDELAEGKAAFPDFVKVFFEYPYTEGIR